MTKNAIKALLLSIGINSVISARDLADVLDISLGTISRFYRSGELKKADRNCFAIDDIVDWLFLYPRFLNKVSVKKEQ